MLLVAGLDVGGSSVKAWVQELGGRLRSTATVATQTLRPAPHRAEMDPDAWEAACRQALGQAVEQAGTGDWLGLTVSTLRQGFVLLGADGRHLGPGITNSDRRGAPYAGVLDGRYQLTGHWPAPELTLPKLLAVRAEEPDRWAATRSVLFLHDWLIWRLCGVQATEASYACAGGMADVVRRTWAVDLLEECGIGLDRLAPVVSAGTQVGELVDGWPLPATLPVVAGCGDTQLAAVSVGGLGDGVLTVVAGSSTPVQAATSQPVSDPLGRPWVSTHAAAELWAVEGNAGYPGSFSGWWSTVCDAPAVDDPGGVVAVTATPYWSRQTWEHKPPWSLVGLSPGTTPGQVRRALLEAHAFAVAGGVEDLERVLGPSSALVVAGGGGPELAPLLAQVLGRHISMAGDGGPARGGAHLVALAVGAHTHVPQLPQMSCPAADPEPLAQRRQRWTEVEQALRSTLPD